MPNLSFINDTTKKLLHLKSLARRAPVRAALLLSKRTGFGVAPQEDTGMANVWFLLRDGRSYGPFQLAQLRQMTTTGQLLPVDLLAQTEGGPWVSASEVPGLYDAALPTTNAPTQDAEPAFDFGGAGGKPDAAARTDNSARTHRSQRNSSGRSRRTAFVVVAGCGLLLLISTGVYFVSRDATKGANATGKSGEVGQSQTGAGRPGSGATSQSYAGGFEAGSALGKQNAQTWANPKLNSSARQSLQKNFTKTHDENVRKYEDARGRFGESNDAVQRLKGIADGYRQELQSVGFPFAR